MTIKLPKSIEAYFEADRDRSPDAVAAAFAVNGVLKDKGKTHKGHDPIRKWMADEGNKYTYTVEPFLISAENGKTQVTAHVVGTFPGSPVDLRYIFVPSDDKIAELEITV